jgi:hypothetical protein
MARPKISLTPVQKMWHDGKLVNVRRSGSKQKPGVEYVLIDATKDFDAGQLFIGYESRNHFNNKTYVNVVRWVPGMAL